MANKYKKAIKNKSDINKMGREELIGSIQYYVPKINDKSKRMFSWNSIVGEWYNNAMIRANAKKYDGKSLDGGIGNFGKQKSGDLYKLSATGKELGKLNTKSLKKYAKELYSLFYENKWGNKKSAKMGFNKTINDSWGSLLKFVPDDVDLKVLEKYKTKIMLKFFEKMKTTEYSSESAFLEAVQEIIPPEEITKTFEKAYNEAKEEDDFINSIPTNNYWEVVDNDK